MIAKFAKALALLRRPRLARAMARHRVAAAVEHLPVIAFTRAATLIDAGANKGQFSLAFRALRPDARIIAFEPLPSAADRYEHVFAGDGRTALQRVALGADEGTAEFFVTDREDSSSLLAPSENQNRAYGVREARRIQVPVKRLDDCVAVEALEGPILLKIDVQGGELGLLKGFTNQMSKVDYIYLELSFVPLYEGQPLHDAVTAWLRERGFVVAGVFNQSWTAAFGPTQADFLFKRE